MAVIKVQTTFNIELDFEAPEFHRRLFAWMIDVFVQILYLIVAGKIYDLILRSRGELNPHDAWGMNWLFWLPVIVYPLFMETMLNGQSIGKRAMGIRVVNENGGKASVGQFMIRWLIRTSDLMIVLLVILSIFLQVLTYWASIAAFALVLTDIVLVVSTAKSQRIGDFLAGTMLIRTSAKSSMADTVFLEVEDSYVPSFPEIMRLSDRDLNAVKSILDSSRKKSDLNLAMLAADKIKSHLQIQTTLEPIPFLETLMKDYNYLSVK